MRHIDRDRNRDRHIDNIDVDRDRDRYIDGWIHPSSWTVFWVGLPVGALWPLETAMCVGGQLDRLDGLRTLRSTNIPVFTISLPKGAWATQ